TYRLRHRSSGPVESESRRKSSRTADTMAVTTDPCAIRAAALLRVLSFIRYTASGDADDLTITSHRVDRGRMYYPHPAKLGAKAPRGTRRILGSAQLVNCVKILTDRRHRDSHFRHVPHRARVGPALRAAVRRGAKVVPARGAEAGAAALGGCHVTCAPGDGQGGGGRDQSPHRARQVPPPHSGTGDPEVTEAAGVPPQVGGVVFAVLRALLLEE